MTIFLPTLAVAFAAFCVWLTVRIVNRRERWATWMLATALVSLLVIYPLSSGPAIWADMKLSASPRTRLLRDAIDEVYAPLFDALDSGPEWIKEYWAAYVGLWVDLRFPEFDRSPDYLGYM